METNNTPTATPDLTSYDLILVSSSAGKDSQAMLDLVVRLASLAGVLDRVQVVHCDLGAMEWHGTGELAAEQAAAYGLPFTVVSRIGTLKTDSRGELYDRGETFGDLLDYVSRRGSFMGPGAKFCTSEFKRAPVRKLMTQLDRELRTDATSFRILNCLGMRADESGPRDQMLPFVTGATPGRNTQDKITKTRHVDTWLPIHAWTEAQVWSTIRKSGVRYHWAYDLGHETGASAAAGRCLGMRRLSCVFCIYATKADLLLAGRHNRALLDRYASVELETGHRFTQRVSLTVIRAELDAELPAEPTADDSGQLALFG